MLQKIALFLGIILIVIAVVLLIGDLSSADIFPVVLGLLGIFAIGVFFLSKKKKWLVSNR
jgi:LPXTG-motif cell wall-anchored protein